MDYSKLMSAFNKGTDSFGQAAQYWGSATANDANADLLDVTAKSVIQSGDFNAQRLRESGDRFLATQRARYAKAGVTFSGSAAYAWAASERNISLDILTTKLNAASKANELGFEALQKRIAAGQARTRAIQAIGQGVLKIGGMYAGASAGTQTTPQNYSSNMPESASWR